MGLQIESEIFKWLQTLKIVKEAKRTSEGKIQLSQAASSKFFDGVYISQITKNILKHRGEQQMANKLSSIRENSTPAIRLYNWNLLGEALKRLGHTIDYSQKSKLLNLEQESITKIIKFLWSVRVEEPTQPGNLTVSLKDIGTRSLKEASNVFELLVISICNNFKLSVQHALNLFLDNNKYLAHLLVKGVKGSYDPVLMMLSDLHQSIDFIVDTLLVVDEKESLDLFLGAMKPCLISKQVKVAESCLGLLKDFIEIYLQKGLKIEGPCNWMERQGFDTIFFSIKRHPTLFAQSFAVAYSYMDDKIFKRLQPQDKSLLWDNQTERLTFYRQLLDESHKIFIDHFVADPVFNQWNKVCVKAMKRVSTSHEQYELLSLFEKLWSAYPEAFEQSPHNLPGSFTIFLKNCVLSQFEIVFAEAARIIFTLIVHLGLAKNPQAPILFKAAISSLPMIESYDHIEFMLIGFVQIMKDIPTLPAAPLVDPLLKLMEAGVSATMLQIVRMVLGEGRIRDFEQQDLEEALLKVIFSDVQHSEMAQELLIEHLKQQQNSQPLEQYCVAALAHFYSLAKQAHKPLKQLKIDFYRYNQQQFLRKIEPAFLRNITKYLHMANIVSFLQKVIFINSGCKQQMEPHIFHTYIRIERELKKQHVSRLLMPLMRSYYDEDQMPGKLQQYLEDILPPAVNFQSIAIADSVEVSPVASNKRLSRLKTEENKKTTRINSISKDLQLIKKKRQEEKERNLMLQKQREAQQEKKHLHLSMINEQRIVEYGKSRQPDVDYKYLLDFDSFKNQNRSLGLPQINLLHLQEDEEEQFIEDATAVMKKYRKLWRYLFFKYSSYGIKGAAENQHPEEKISGADILKFLKDYNMEQLISKEKVLLLVRRVNQLQKRKNDPGNLPYLGFEQYILQYCFVAYKKEHPQNSPGRQVMQFIDDIRRVTAARGGSVEMFDSPEEMYFQETDVIRQFNRRLSQNPDYPLPQGYKKIKQTQFKYNYTVTQFQKGVNQSRTDVVEVLDDILFHSMGFRILEPLTHCEEKNLARPVLFQKMKEKIKDYHGGYLMPKKSAYLPRIDKEPSPVKVDFHIHVPFSLGIKLGIAGTDPKVKILAEQVAYWLDDALDAVEAGRNTVGNKSKARVQNDLIRRKRSEALQFRIQKHEQEKKERKRAETLKHQTAKYHEEKKEVDKKTREELKKQRLKRRERQQKLMDKRKLEYQQALSKLQAKRKEVQQKKEAELKVKRKEHEKYKKNVDEYFKKKKSEIQEQERSMKASKQETIKIQQFEKKRQEQMKKKLEIEVFKKEESVLEKLATSKETYEQTWKSEQIQEEIRASRTGLKLMFDLLVKYEKSKISTTGVDEIGLNTLNFYALRTRITPLILSKNAMAILFRSMIKNEKHNGITFPHFLELLFKIAVKGKEVLNKPISNNQESQMGESRLPTLKSSPEIDRKKSLTDQYALDATGVTSETVRHLMQFLDLPQDKAEAEEMFRGLLERKSSKPTNSLLKEARSMLESRVL